LLFEFSQSDIFSGNDPPFSRLASGTPTIGVENRPAGEQTDQSEEVPATGAIGYDGTPGETGVRHARHDESGKHTSIIAHPY